MERFESGDIYCGTDAFAYTHSDSDSDTYFHAHRDTHTYRDTHTHSDAHTYSDVHTYSDTYANSDTHPYGNTYANSNPYTYAAVHLWRPSRVAGRFGYGEQYDFRDRRTQCNDGCFQSCPNNPNQWRRVQRSSHQWFGFQHGLPVRQ